MRHIVRSLTLEEIDNGWRLGLDNVMREGSVKYFTFLPDNPAHAVSLIRAMESREDALIFVDGETYNIICNTRFLLDAVNAYLSCVDSKCWEDDV